MSYNGWSNRTTWNVSLWLNNDEPMYRALQDVVKHTRKDEQTLADAIEALCLELWPNGKTPDGCLLSQCNFVEIAAAEIEDAE